MQNRRRLAPTVSEDNGAYIHCFYDKSEKELPRRNHEPGDFAVSESGSRRPLGRKVGYFLLQ